MNALPINKIFLAGFAFALTHWKKIIEISIIPLLLSLPLLLNGIEVFKQIEQAVTNQTITLTEYFGVYLLLFFYGYVTFIINIYRLVVLGEDSVRSFTPLLDGYKIINFIGLVLLISLMTLALFVLVMLLLSGLKFQILGNEKVLVLLQFMIYFFIVPVTLNFVSIAINQPFKLQWNLSLRTHVSLFLIQVIFPTAVVIILSYLTNIIEFIFILEWVVGLMLFYWLPITLALCYRLINTTNNSA
jgi:hypothetical protein